jgi:hypothetical protein
MQSLGVNGTKLSSQQNILKNFISKFFSFFAGVVDTADKHSFANISANFRKKFEMVLMGYSGARGTLIYEKNLKAKISCQTPFNGRNTSFFIIYCRCFYSSSLNATL